jgi:L-ascorbate metabolism protein UlaG (beta-lactamase superfamily)
MTMVYAMTDLEGFVFNHLTWFGQSSFVIMAKSGQILYIDPVRIPDSFASADVILITHSHFDHFNLLTINHLKKCNTSVIVPQSMIRPKWEGLTAWQTIQKGSFKITGVPAYNINSDYHPKNLVWLGYIIEVDGIKIYHAGDTDLIPEMQKINVDIALLPIGGKYTMNVEEAVKATKIIQAKLFIPIHYGDTTDTSGSGAEFVSLLKPGKAKELTAVY